MHDEPPREVRRTVTFSPGARVAVLVAALLLIAAVYAFWVPLTVPNPAGAPFRCSTAAQPPTDAFAKAFCGTINTQYRYRALALLASALVVGVGGFFLFGERRTVTRPAREQRPDEHGVHQPGR